MRLHSNSHVMATYYDPMWTFEYLVRSGLPVPVDLEDTLIRMGIDVAAMRDRLTQDDNIGFGIEGDAA